MKSSEKIRFGLAGSALAIGLATCEKCDPKPEEESAKQQVTMVVTNGPERSVAKIESPSDEATKAYLGDMRAALIEKTRRDLAIEADGEEGRGKKVPGFYKPEIIEEKNTGFRIKIDGVVYTVSPINVKDTILEPVDSTVESGKSCLLLDEDQSTPPSISCDELEGTISPKPTTQPGGCTADPDRCA